MDWRRIAVISYLTLIPKLLDRLETERISAPSVRIENSFAGLYTGINRDAFGESWTPACAGVTKVIYSPDTHSGLV